jgi:hypothetical protein
MVLAAARQTRVGRTRHSVGCIAEVGVQTKLSASPPPSSACQVHALTCSEGKAYDQLCHTPALQSTADRDG